MAGGNRSSLVRYLLGGLLAFGSLNAFAGGVYGLSGAEGVPLELLEGSPFRTYFVPGLILFVVVGGSLLFAAVAVLAGSRIARVGAVTAGTVVLVWIAVQVSVIGYVSVLQPATALGGLLILVMSLFLPGGSRKARDGT